MKFIVTAHETVTHEREIEAPDRITAGALFINQTGRVPESVDWFVSDDEIEQNTVVGRCELTGRVVFEDEDYKTTQNDLLLSPEAYIRA